MPQYEGDQPQWGYDWRQQPSDPNAMAGQAPSSNVRPITERYDDSYGRLLQSLQNRSAGQTAFADLLGGFRGRIGDLQKFMETPAWRTGLAYSLRGTDAYQQLSGLQDPTKQTLSMGLGQLGAAGGRAIEQQLSALSAMGLGRNASLTGAAELGGRLETAGKQAEFAAGVNQQAYQNERSRLSELVGLEQAMQQLALGFNPQPRTKDSGPGTGDWIKLALQAAGTVAMFSSGVPAAI